MTQTWDCTEARPALGVYVLGAIDPFERGLVDAHLATCRDCRDELAGLAGLPALLARVDPDEISRISAGEPAGSVTSDEPPEEVLATVRSLAEARRRKTRWRYLSAAAAVVALAAGLFGGVKAATSTTTTHTVVVPFQHITNWENASATNQATGVSGTVAYSPQLWGKAVKVLVDRIPVGTTCQLWAVHPDGTRTFVTSWTTAQDEGKVWYDGSIPATAKPIGQYEITAGGKVLLTVTPT